MKSSNETVLRLQLMSPVEEEVEDPSAIAKGRMSRIRISFFSIFRGVYWYDMARETLHSLWMLNHLCIVVRAGVSCRADVDLPEVS